jgi:hypothetical protein
LIILGLAVLRDRLVLLGLLVGIFGRPTARAASTHTWAPTRFDGYRSVCVLPLGGLPGVRECALGRSFRRTSLGGSAEDRVDQLSLAQPAKSFEAELVGDRVQVGQRTVLESGAVEY